MEWEIGYFRLVFRNDAWQLWYTIIRINETRMLYSE